MLRELTGSRLVSCPDTPGPDVLHPVLREVGRYRVLYIGPVQNMTQVGDACSTQRNARIEIHSITGDHKTLSSKMKQFVLLCGVLKAHLVICM